jgi:hypothetical protein
MNSYIVDCLEPQPGSFTSTLRADAHPHEHASSGWGGAPLYIRSLGTNQLAELTTVATGNDATRNLLSGPAGQVLLPGARNEHEGAIRARLPG